MWIELCPNTSIGFLSSQKLDHWFRPCLILPNDQLSCLDLSTFDKVNIIVRFSFPEEYLTFSEFCYGETENQFTQLGVGPRPEEGQIMEEFYVLQSCLIHDLRQRLIEVMLTNHCEVTLCEASDFGCSRLIID